MYGENLKRIREEANISQYSISEYLGLNKRVYGQYEREYVIIPIKHLNTICNYLNVSLDYVFGFTNIKQYPSVKGINQREAGLILKEWRKSQNITQEKLAKKLNTHKSVICGYEKGRYLIATPFLYDICKKYKISADYLLGRTQSPKTL